jgi:5-methylcytosine-specific restriction endonuclease McrA
MVDEEWQIKNQEKAKLLIEFEGWYRKKYNYPVGRIEFTQTSIAQEFFQEKNRFERSEGHCRICNRYLATVGLDKRRHYCSDECREKANLFNWQMVKHLYSCIVNCDYVCVLCGCDNKGIDVDHIRPVANGGSMFDIKNLRYLCETCNRSRPKPIKFTADQKQLSIPPSDKSEGILEATL